jgi:hypothetical protein
MEENKMNIFLNTIILEFCYVVVWSIILIIARCFIDFNIFEVGETGGKILLILAFFQALGKENKPDKGEIIEKEDDYNTDNTDKDENKNK